MPSIREVIFRAGLSRPDVYPEETKAQWLLELEGKLLQEVMRHKMTAGPKYTGRAVMCPNCMKSTELEYNRRRDMTRCSCGWYNGPVIPKEYPEDGDMELLVKAPYDNLYDLYLFAQVSLHNREVDNYNDDSELFDQAKKEWSRKWHQTHLPVSPMELEEWEKVVV